MYDEINVLLMRFKPNEPYQHSSLIHQHVTNETIQLAVDEGYLAVVDELDGVKRYVITEKGKNYFRS